MQVTASFAIISFCNATTVAVPSFVLNEHWWEEPDFACWPLRLALRPAVVLDKRRTDLSDHVSEPPARTADCGQILLQNFAGL